MLGKVQTTETTIFTTATSEAPVLGEKMSAFKGSEGWNDLQRTITAVAKRQLDRSALESDRIERLLAADCNSLSIAALCYQR